ncbi:MAG TPA: hypothetical protein VKI19_02355, partial [Acidimicrobiales bacterium]|nr:hypothetical protein [Acidimicrobiales bacterium]
MEHVEEPRRAYDIGAVTLCSAAKSPIRGHDEDGVAFPFEQRDQHVVAGTGSVDDLDPVDHALLDSGTRRPFQDHDDRSRHPAADGSCTDAFNELAACSRAVSPPPVGARANDVRGINEDHPSSLAHPLWRGTSTFPPRCLLSSAGECQSGADVVERVGDGDVERS